MTICQIVHNFMVVTALLAVPIVWLAQKLVSVGISMVNQLFGSNSTRKAHDSTWLLPCAITSITHTINPQKRD